MQEFKRSPFYEWSGELEKLVDTIAEAKAAGKRK
jgi:hypothetical protein